MTEKDMEALILFMAFATQTRAFHTRNTPAKIINATLLFLPNFRVQLVKNGGKNKSVAFIILVSLVKSGSI